MRKYSGAGAEYSFSKLKGTVHPKMRIPSSITHPQVLPNPYECVCSEHKGRYFEESLQPGAPLTSIFEKKITMEVNGAPKLLRFPHSSEYLALCSAYQTHSYRFENT